MEDEQVPESYDIFISHNYKDYEKVILYLKCLEDKLYRFGKFFPGFIAHKDITSTKK